MEVSLCSQRDFEAPCYWMGASALLGLSAGKGGSICLMLAISENPRFPSKARGYIEILWLA